MLISADDRTGAAEVAGAIATMLSVSVPVDTSATLTAALTTAPSGPLGAVGDTAWRVVDLGTRHLSPPDARELVGRWSSSVVAHKMDSTLRGNWSDEVAGIVATGRRALVVPALPSMGRTCVGGIVLEHGRPVHEGPAGTDVRRRLATSDTTALLAGAGLGDVRALTPADIGRWLTSDSRCAVADVGNADDLVAVALAWSHHRPSNPDTSDDRPVLVGTSAAIAAGATSLVGVSSLASAPRHGRSSRAAAKPVGDLHSPALVICGSLHPMARAQVELAERAGVAVAAVADDHAVGVLADGQPLILASEIAVGPIDTPIAIAAASGLARDAATLLDSVPIGSVVIIGGDTANAVIGDRVLVVENTIESGMPIGHIAGLEPPIITRAGGFGSIDSLDRLVRYQLVP